MVKRQTVARDAANIRRVRKAIRTQGIALRQVPASPEARRDEWIARYPEIVTAA